MDTTQSLPHLPEGFSSFLEETTLPVPPIPLQLLPALEAFSDKWFSTDARQIRESSLLFLGDLESALGEDPDSPSDFVGYGLIGHRFGTPQVLYLLQHQGLRLGVCLPWGSVYTDSQAERDNLQAALQIMELCLQACPQKGHLDVLVSRSSCLWHYCSDTTDLEGEDLNGLLRALEIALEATESVPMCQWIAV